MNDETFRDFAARGKIPPQLLALWRMTANRADVLGIVSRYTPTERAEYARFADLAEWRGYHHQIIKTAFWRFFTASERYTRAVSQVVLSEFARTDLTKGASTFVYNYSIDSYITPPAGAANEKYVRDLQGILIDAVEGMRAGVTATRGYIFALEAAVKIHRIGKSWLEGETDRLREKELKQMESAINIANSFVEYAATLISERAKKATTDAEKERITRQQEALQKYFPFLDMEQFEAPRASKRRAKQLIQDLSGFRRDLWEELDQNLFISR